MNLQRKLAVVTPIALLLSLVSCTVLQVEDDDSEPPGQILYVNEGLSGSLKMRAPDVQGFDELPTPPTRVYFECESTVKVYDEKATESNKPETAQFDPDLSRAAKNECTTELAKILLAKKLTLMPEPEGAERWLFRFEETRTAPEPGLRVVFSPKTVRLWATLTRFLPGEPKPYAHRLVMGASAHEGGAWDSVPGVRSTSDDLFSILSKSLVMKAITERPKLDP